MLRSWLFEMTAVIAALFGFGSTASVAHDLAKLSFYLGPVYDIGKFVFFGNP
jgi:uncharacterized membrane protein YtjA (UPF0391 family)